MIARRQLSWHRPPRLALARDSGRAAHGRTAPVKIIVTFPPGGASDAAARVIAGPLSEKLGQTVIVDNKPGGGTTIGANFVLAAKDDFHTLMLSNSAPISIAPYLFDKPPYDPLKDFVHVAYIGSVANAFVVRPAVPAKTMPELIAWIKGAGQDRAVRLGRPGLDRPHHRRDVQGRARPQHGAYRLSRRRADVPGHDGGPARLRRGDAHRGAAARQGRQAAHDRAHLDAEGAERARRAAGHRARLPEAGGRELRRPLRAGGLPGRRRRPACTRRRPRCWPTPGSSSGWAISASSPSP